MKSHRVLHRIGLPGRFAVFSILCGALCFAGIAGAQAQIKVAVVDVSKVFTGYRKTREYEAKIDEAREASKRELGSRMENHHRLVEEIAKLDKDIGNPATGAASKADLQRQRDDKTKEIHSLEEATGEFKASRERALQEQTIRVRTQIVEDILTVIQARVERDHYDFILNSSGRGLKERILVLYANPSLDISDDVIAALNRDSPAAVAPTPTAP